MGNKLDEVLEEKTNSVASEIQTDASGQNKSGRPKHRLACLSWRPYLRIRSPS